MTPTLSVPAPERREWLTLGSILLFALLLRLCVINNHGLQSTDFITWTTIQSPMGELIRERLEHNHMPLYFMGIKLWTGVAGDSETALRLPSIFLSVLGVFALWWMARPFFGPGPALFAAALGAFHQFWLHQSMEARVYAPLYPLCLFAAGFWLRWLYSRKGRDLTGYLIFAALALAIHLMSLSMFAALAILLWLKRRPAEQWPGAGWKALLWTLAPCIALIPLMAAWATMQQKIGNIPHWELPGFGRLFRNFLSGFLGDYERVRALGMPVDVIRALTIPLTLGTFGALGWMLRRGVWRGEKMGEASRNAFVLLTWLILLPPAGLFLAAMRTGGVIGITRYLALSVIFAPVLIAGVCLGLPWPRVRKAGAALIVIAAAIQTGGYIAGPGEGIRQGVEFVASLDMEDAQIFTCAGGNSERAFEYYGHALPYTDLPRTIDDKKELAEIIEKQFDASARHYYVFIYHPKDAPVVDIFKTTPGLKRREKRVFGATEVHIFDRVTP